MDSLWDKLTHYGASEVLPMHMPGHKRKTGFMRGVSKYDITEVSGFDDLHQAEGILKEAMADASALYGSDRTYFLINGSTCGVLTAITAAVPAGSKVLIARNCHKSALHALAIRNIDPVWISPKAVSPLHVWGSITPDAVEKALEKESGIKAVIIVSPTYEGIVSDIEGIATAAHKRNIPLIVDAAHGAHFRFGEDFPADALSLGADYVIESLHKTLPSLTQTAVLHIKGKLADRERTEQALQIYMSTSPSYLLIASCAECLRIMKAEGKTGMSKYYQRLNELRGLISSLSECVLLGREGTVFDHDPGKVVFGFRGYTGGEIAAHLLNTYRIETEADFPGYTVTMTSICDSDEDLFRFGSALKQLRRELPLRGNQMFPELKMPSAEKVMSPAEAMDCETVNVPLLKAAGKISAHNICPYPPGTPLLTAGEKISQEHIEAAMFYAEHGCALHGIHNGAIAAIAK